MTDLQNDDMRQINSNQIKSIKSNQIKYYCGPKSWPERGLNWRLFTGTRSFIKPKSGCVTIHACLHSLFTICNYEILTKSTVCPTNLTAT